MDKEQLLGTIAMSLAAVRTPHYYEDERGFQGEFYAQLHRQLQDVILPEGAILREEYQKRLLQHGLKIRPDIILHEPFNPDRHHGRDDGNHAVMELKRRAKRRDAIDAFKNLISMIDTLRYPLGVFINIDSLTTWAELVPEDYRSRITCLAVSLGKNGVPQVVRA
ncbi:hypothetical protein [Pseudomonas sp. CGJS7]|uniref:hypothetical protein n=1 Tax=Pseudomonas sp. CGJS7 TaxID=3109348 RepID=UPI003008CB34